ncbi:MULTISPECIES: DNA breaking-rejoining protein [Pantoea]|uniref:DNA breaking-rejoining protein n=2 Tax=Pantoea TaxID=53335 RepID=A0ACC5PXF8_ENTAG|nr:MULTISPECIES: DNA breaking-rejoining protein [Pantoea]KAA5927829.1 DNA breaking-rejoining protein [Pantoea sp. VH_8]KAA5932559.1 DNA breaking-rejoining protein [Pantoea sp. VH_4]KAA5984858.1 DNA breaking-rejoining protein [Pantoea sp. M_4]KAA6122218.1 DNA breaking-rejoining protein [Pantoea gossypiicola]MBD8129025.1 DNA breaking-rejoining protein [Pantoea agglomerans]
MKTISIINFQLCAINSELASFNCEGSITGVIHTTPSNTTVVLDGGYVLGRYGCVHKAVDELTDIHMQLHDAEKENGTYTEYKKNMVGTVFH